MSSSYHAILRTRLSWWRGTNHHSPCDGVSFVSGTVSVCEEHHVRSRAHPAFHYKLPVFAQSPIPKETPAESSCWLSFVFHRKSNLVISIVVEVIVPRPLSQPLLLNDFHFHSIVLNQSILHYVGDHLFLSIDTCLMVPENALTWDGRSTG